LNIVTSCYEEAIFSVKFEYSYIAKTESFAVVLSYYRNFLSKQFEDFSGAIRYLEESIEIFERINVKNQNYEKALNQLESSYHKLYLKTRDSDYKYQRDKIKQKKSGHNTRYS